MKRYKLAYLLLLGMLCASCGVQENETAEQSVEVQSEETESVQEAYLLTFEGTTTEGETLTSACLSDAKLTMINVWATYCNPCLVEMPDLGEIASEYDGDKLQVLGIVSDVTWDDTKENIGYAKELIEETKATYTHLLLNESLYVNLVGGIEALPTTFFVTREGEVLGYVVGARSKEGWIELIEQLLAELDE